MKRMTCAAIAAMAIGAAAARAQTPVPAPEKTPLMESRMSLMPKPGPEVEKLGYFQGQWTSTGRVKPGALGDGGETKGRSSCGWMPGKFFLGCMTMVEGPMGRIQTETILGYDAERKLYTSTSFDSTGRTETATGKLEDGTWTWSSETKLGGKTVRSRYVVSDSTADAYAYRWETSPDGKEWAWLTQGKADKMAGKPTAIPMRRPPTPTPTPAP